MALVLLALAGFFVGYRLEMTRAGYICMALTTIASSAAQVIHLLVTQRREAMTMLPLVVGLVLVLFMFIGAMFRLRVLRAKTA